MGQNDEFIGRTIGGMRAGLESVIRQEQSGEFVRVRDRFDPAVVPDVVAPPPQPARASLWFKSGRTMIFDAVRPLTRFKAVMGERMQSAGFTAIAIDDFQVAGDRNGGWTALHPVWRSNPGGGREEYVFVVMCAATSEDVAANNAGDVDQMIGWEDDLWP